MSLQKQHKEEVLENGDWGNDVLKSATLHRDDKVEKSATLHLEGTDDIVMIPLPRNLWQWYSRHFNFTEQVFFSNFT